MARHAAHATMLLSQMTPRLRLNVIVQHSRNNKAVRGAGEQIGQSQ
jgi:hypothetical protein